MRRFLPASLLLALVTAACAGAPATPAASTRPATATGSVSGTVEAQGAGIEVYLAYADGSAVPRLAHAKTDAGGAFGLTGVPSGYTFVVAAKVKDAAGQDGELETLVHTGSGPSTVSLTLASTVLTAGLLAGGGVPGNFDASVFASAVSLTAAHMGINRPDVANHAELVETLTDVAREDAKLAALLPQLKSQLATGESSAAQVQGAIDLLPGSASTPAPPGPTPTAPPVGLVGANPSIAPSAAGASTSPTSQPTDGATTTPASTAPASGQPTVAPSPNVFAAGQAPTELLVNPNGTVWVTNRGAASSTVTALSTSTGAKVGSYTVDTPGAFGVDGGQNVWVTSEIARFVYKFSGSGAQLAVKPIADPFAIAFDPGGRPWVDSPSTGTLYRLNDDGTLAQSYAIGGTPGRMAFDHGGTLWILGPTVNNVVAISSTGVQLGSYFTGSNPGDIAADGTAHLWIANTGSNTVSEITDGGTFVGSYATDNQPARLAVASDNSVWVTCTGSNTLTHFSASGTVLRKITVGSKPVGVAIDAGGNVWVANSGDDTVTRVVP